MSKRTKVDITPDKSLIQKLGQTGYRTEQAVSELIDNSIDARIPGKIMHVDVVLDFEGGMITVGDDGVGMGLGGLRDAMTVARRVKTDKSSLGRFGLGMKSACSALGKVFRITTAGEGSRVKYHAEYDESKWLGNNSATWSDFEVVEQKNESVWHGTVIEITGLNVPLYPNQTSSFKKSFGMRYGPYLESDSVVLAVNSMQCKPTAPIVQPGTRKKIDIPLSSGNRLRGWIGLLEKRSIKGNYGFHLYKNGRLIRPFDKFGIRNHPEFAKVIGEISLDHVPVNFHKTGFLTESPEYREALHEFGENNVKRYVARLLASKYASPSTVQDVFDYFSGDADPGYAGGRTSRAAKEELLSGAYPTRAEGTCKVEFADAGDDDIYTVTGAGGDSRLVVNRSGRAFDAVKNPLALVGLIGAEARLLEKNPELNKFIQERNDMWAKFLKDWGVGRSTQGQGTRRGRNVPASYSLSPGLAGLHGFLMDRFEHDFQFTGLSTLHSFLHYDYGRMIYTVHTKTGTGQQLYDLVLEYPEREFTAMLNPKASEMNTALGVSEKPEFLVIREYSSGISSDRASPEKAWMDLYVETIKRGMPFPQDELHAIFSELVAAELVNMSKLRSIARRRKMLNEVVQYVEGEEW